METRIDFLEYLEPDMALKILACLDDSADLVRASVVSRHWKNIVVSNGLCKQLCMRTYPQLATITRVVELSHDNLGETERDDRAYASLFRAITTFQLNYCIASPVSASSTGDYPKESIKNTMVAKKTTTRRGYYWSSKGSDDPETPETLIYKLTSVFCVVTDVILHPFQGLFESDFSIQSSKSVRFRMGYPKSWKDLNYDFIAAQECADDKFTWTYTSPVFPMAQKNRLQRFKLPEPIVCIGGYLQIELRAGLRKHWMRNIIYVWLMFKQRGATYHLYLVSSFLNHPTMYISSMMLSNLEIVYLCVITVWYTVVQAHDDGVEYEWVDDDEVENDGEDEIDSMCFRM